MLKFSIIIVCLNPGRELHNTVKSVVDQTYSDYEIIVKDGGSTDGAVDALERCIKARKDSGAEIPDSGDSNTDNDRIILKDTSQIKIVREKDSSIYEAMNQAIEYATGDYCLFLNCGDYLYDEAVLEKAAEYMERDGGTVKVGNIEGTGDIEGAGGIEGVGKLERSRGRDGSENRAGIYYGDIYDRLRKTHISSPPSITPFVCFRNVPCHQACFYSLRLMKGRNYNTKYRVRADYDHFLASFFLDGCRPVDMGITVASYEGGGYSESEKGSAISAAERTEILPRYMSRGMILRFRLYMILSLQPLRAAISGNPRMAAGYQRLKSIIYRKCNYSEPSKLFKNMR